ncbi:Sua5 YciO YrdC YwlC family protein [Hydrogenimonas sp.]
MHPELVYLAQTDTTVGFLSQSARRLAKVKGRSLKRPFLMAFARFEDIAMIGRVPAAHRRFVRRSVKTSFILPSGLSFRVVCDERHKDFIEKCGWCYTTSANLHGKPFDEPTARDLCDVVVESKEGFSDKAPSSIWRLKRWKKERVR